MALRPYLSHPRAIPCSRRTQTPPHSHPSGQLLLNPGADPHTQVPPSSQSSSPLSPAPPSRSMPRVEAARLTRRQQASDPHPPDAGSGRAALGVAEAWCLDHTTFSPQRQQRFRAPPCQHLRMRIANVTTTFGYHSDGPHPHLSQTPQPRTSLHAPTQLGQRPACELRSRSPELASLPWRFCRLE